MTRSRRPSAQTTAVVLALAEDPTAWRYGYQLCQQLGLKPGSLYPILVRLADRGLLETTWDTDVPQVDGTFSWTIEATPNGFTGTIDIQDTSCVSSGQVDIALEGDTITIGSIQAEQPITFTGTVSGDTMSGTYDASACPPPNTGSWEAARSG